MKKLLLSLSLLAISATASAQLTASSAFSSAPSKVFPLLDMMTRLDMVDYFNSGMDKSSDNKLAGKSVITAMTPEALTIRMTDSSTSQLVVLQGDKAPVIALISTVATPGLDSSMSFYDDSWNLLPAEKFFIRPDWKQWLTPAGSANEAEVSMQVPFMLASYSYNPSDGTLTVTNNLSQFLDKEVYDDIASYLYPVLTYRWDGKKFVMVK